MTRSRTLAWSVGVLVALSAGSAAASSDAASSDVPRRLGGDLPAYEAPASRPAFAEPAGDLTLREALSLALLHNPGLASDSWQMRAREAEQVQAGRRPNPELTLEIENFAGSGPLGDFDGAETTLALSQMIELGGKRAKRAEEARLGRHLAGWDYEVRRIDVLTETAASFVEVLAAQERIALADTLVQVAEDVLASVSRRVRAGGVSPVEERRARVSMETSRIDRNRTLRALDVARARLGVAWGGSVPAFGRAVGDLALAADNRVPTLESLADRLEGSPQVALWTVELDRRRASREVAGSIGVPNLTVLGGVRHFNEIDEGALVLGVSLPLPVFDRNRGATDAAERRIQQAHEEQREVRARVWLALASAHAALAAADNEAAALRDRILPEAEAAFVESHQAYARGRLRLTDVLDAQRSAFELRSRNVDVLAVYHVMVAEIERLLGTPLHVDNSSAGDR